MQTPSLSLHRLNIGLEVPTLAVIGNDGSGAVELVQDLIEQEFVSEPYSIVFPVNYASVSFSSSISLFFYTFAITSVLVLRWP